MRGSFAEVLLGGICIVVGLAIGILFGWILILVGIALLWDAWEESRKR